MIKNLEASCPCPWLKLLKPDQQAQEIDRKHVVETGDDPGQIRLSMCVACVTQARIDAAINDAIAAFFTDATTSYDPENT